jgi:hypothetical protein
MAAALACEHASEVRYLAVARKLLLRGPMRKSAMALCGVLLLGCGAALYEDGDDDVDDLEAKTDQSGTAAPGAGLYLGSHADGFFPEYYDRHETLDLRRDGTFFAYMVGGTELGEGNYGEGVAHLYGTYKPTKDAHGNKYLRFTVDGDSWREKYTMLSATSFRLYWRNGEFYTQKRQPAPTRAWVDKAKAGYLAKERMYEIGEIYARDVPTAMRNRSYDLKDTYEDLKMWRLNVDDAKAYVMTFGGRAEIYGANEQLLAIHGDGAWTYSLY